MSIKRKKSDKVLDDAEKPAKVKKFKALRRELDNTIYAYTCNGCGYSWKVYQNQYHGEGCPYL